MRTNLKVSFAEKDKVKALGARWDPALKLWYVENVSDLTRFAAWIPALSAHKQDEGAEKKSQGAKSAPSKPRARATPLVSGPSVDLPDCGCDALPWEHCEHTLPH
jgi:hypothetical protein